MDADIRSVKHGAVQINDAFWQPRRRLIYQEMIPYQWKALNDQLPDTEPSGCMKNFRVAAGDEAGAFYGKVFQDSDLAKWIEGAAFTLGYHADPDLEKTIDEVVELLARVQRKDGYLNTYYIINGLDKRFTNVMNHHELYCCGHFIEAAVAYYRVTGKRKLLDIMCRYADYIDSVFGPEAGKLHGYPGHEIIEMALVKLHAVTGEERYLKLAAYFVNERGRTPNFFMEELARSGEAFKWEKSPFGLQYYQAGMPVREQDQAQGHAVRAVYLYSGMADIARMQGDQELAERCRKLFCSIARRQMYITGGIGGSAYGESFIDDYELPNDTIYGETCAAIGLVFFAYRMLLSENDRLYADVMERVLYNGAISGMSLDGKKFFYVNPLEVNPNACQKDFKYHYVKPQRQKWFKCACCPPNLARMVASIDDYMYTVTGDRVNVHLYIGSDSALTLDSGELLLRQETDYPWNGRVTVTVRQAPDQAVTLAFRIPAWCASYSLCVNGEPVSPQLEKGYALIRRTWRTDDSIVLHMDMPARLVAANPLVRADAGKVAVTRGPIVYCAEEADNGYGLYLLRMTDQPNFSVSWTDALSGVMEIHADMKKLTADAHTEELYDQFTACAYADVRVRLIPYYAWANRSEGEMRVWFTAI